MKLGIIGCGKMGRALLEGILRAGLCRPGDVLVHDPVPAAQESAARDLGVAVAPSNAALVEGSEVALLCVKPQGFLEMLGELGECRDRLLLSIAAGIRLDAIEEATRRRHRVVRAMPNTPALVGRGASAFACGSSASSEDAVLARRLLGSVGYVCEVDEAQLDAVTALSGSGPAYLFLMVEALTAAGIAEGLPPELALDLASHTVAGASELLLQSDESPARLRENVTSPNGTTFAALESFRAGGFEGIVGRAVAAAAARSRELGR